MPDTRDMFPIRLLCVAKGVPQDVERLIHSFVPPVSLGPWNAFVTGSRGVRAGAGRGAH